MLKQVTSVDVWPDVSIQPFAGAETEIARLVQGHDETGAVQLHTWRRNSFVRLQRHAEPTIGPNR